mmetsp:Transcript_18363/g.8563  ORF Transcript_18363/g.8563 Transcript_18363/m.8563 type:complete len:87 (+) Transcript_18363:710-970(+)
MQFDPETLEFLITLSMDDDLYKDNEPVFLLELYTRNKPESIPYGLPSTEKIIIKHVKLDFRMALEFVPDPRHVIEDANDARKDENF